jgi:DHA1 family inner membrane transport protein
MATHTKNDTRAAARIPIAVWAMTIAAFAMGADEFIVAGVVEEIAEALSITYGQVGHFESVYALGVAVGAPLFVALGLRLPRRLMLLGTATIFVAGNLISALGPSYEMIMVGRVVSAMAHGAFFGIAAVYAAELVDASRKGQAIAVVFAGATAATVLGAPLGAGVGQLFGWRWTFGSLVVFGGIALLGLIALLPRTRTAEAGDARMEHGEHAHTAEATHGGHAHGHDPAHGAQHEVHADDGAVSEADLEGLDAHARMHMAGAGGARDVRSQLRALRRPPVWVSLLMTLLGYGGVFTTYVYIAPQLTEAAGFDRVWVTPLLLLFGVGLFVGNLLGGKLADRHPTGAVVGTVGALSAMLFAMTALIETQVTAVLGMFLFGLVAWSVVAPLQLRIVTKAADAPDVSSSANISAFTLGSALGIYVGGLAIDGGLGLTSVNWIGGLLSLAGFALALVSWLWIDRRYGEEHAQHADHELAHDDVSHRVVAEHAAAHH